MYKLTIKRSQIDYVLVFLLVVMTAGVSFLGAPVFRLFLLFFSLFVIQLRNISVGLNNFRYLLMFYIVWIIGIFIYFSIDFPASGQVLTYFSFLTLVVCSYYAVKALDNFFRTYVKVIYHLAIISLVFFTVQQINYELVEGLVQAFDPINEFFKGETRSSIILYSNPLGTDFLARNSGFATEPGEFSVFLILALFIQATLNKFRIDSYTTILFLALLTTVSTAGYIGLALLGFYYILEKKPISRKFIFAVLAVPFILLLMNQNFVTDKIEESIEEEKRRYPGAYTQRITPGRFGSLLLDLQDFKENPIVGYGLHSETRYINFGGVEQQRTNGLSEYLVTFGLIGFIILVFNHIRSLQLLRNETKIKPGTLLVIAGIYATVFAQDILVTPLFFALQFYHFTKEI